MSTPKKTPKTTPVELDMAKVHSRTRPYDAARYLNTGEQMATYLSAALEDGEPHLVALAVAAKETVQLVSGWEAAEG